MKINNIKNRATIINLIRDFFTSRDYLELETPILSPYLIPESHLEIFETQITNPFKDSKEAYLIPSPEVWLKKFLSVNPVNIFEISKCFRNSEQTGIHHNHEFTMIEFYTMDFNHLDSLKLTIKLLNYLNEKFTNSKLSKENIEITMDEAFINYAGFSLEKNYNIVDLKQRAKDLDIYTDESDDWESTFNRIFVDIVEPNLPKDKNVFLTNFPSEIKTLAKSIPNSRWAERWELYINGIECGNCYSEEADEKKVREYFKGETDVTHNIDDTYPSIFNNFPKCSGVAIGIDRLIMGILGIEEIQGVILFPLHDII